MVDYAGLPFIRIFICPYMKRLLALDGEKLSHNEMRVINVFSPTTIEAAITNVTFFPLSKTAKTCTVRFH